MSSPSSKGPRQIPLIRPCEVSDLAALERMQRRWLELNPFGTSTSTPLNIAAPSGLENWPRPLRGNGNIEIPLLKSTKHF